LKTLVAAALLNAVLFAGFVIVAVPVHAAVPCEEALKEMRAAKAAAKLNDADKAKVDALEAKAVERCNADDDARSDGFSADAMKIMGK
jgi:BarA-like signal transduction histidine kinase